MDLNATERPTAVPDVILRTVLEVAPHKQVAPDGRPSGKIGRTPGVACEAIRFLVAVNRWRPHQTDVAAKLNELADWVIELQGRSIGYPWDGGVPSTPDLPAPQDAWFYTMDAAFCADAMFRLHDMGRRQEHLTSALGFAGFLDRMVRGPVHGPKPLAICESLTRAGGGAAWNCKSYVKNLVSLPVFMRAAQYAGGAYEKHAERLRSTLLPGLIGGWEYADHCDANCDTKWGRVPGPHHQPNYFVYGDTVAYALRGLFEYEGVSNTVAQIYDHYAGFSGSDSKGRSYDPRVAFAGYLIPQRRAADSFSGYYDLVTLGLLHELRVRHRPQHAQHAMQHLARLVQADRIPWRMLFDDTLPAGESVDLTTLVHLGEAWLQANDRSSLW